MKKTILVVLMALMMISSVIAISPIGSVILSDSAPREAYVYTENPSEGKVADDLRTTESSSFNEGRQANINPSLIAEPAEFWGSTAIGRQGFVDVSCSGGSGEYADLEKEGDGGKNFIYGQICSADEAVILKACTSNNAGTTQYVNDPDYSCYILRNNGWFGIGGSTTYKWLDEGSSAYRSALGSYDSVSRTTESLCSASTRPKIAKSSEVDCIQLFGDPYQKRSKSDGINLKTACNGYNCYDSNIMNSATQGYDWFNKAIDNRYIVTSCVSCETASEADLYTCDDPDGKNDGVRSTTVLRKDGAFYADGEDYCSDSKTLMEFYCDSRFTKQGKIGVYSEECDDRCSNGRCVSSSGGDSGGDAGGDNAVGPVDPYAYTGCEDEKAVWFNTNGKVTYVIDECQSDEECYQPSTGPSKCRDLGDVMIDAADQIRCGGCQGNRFVQFDVGREGALQEPPATGFEKFLIDIGLKEDTAGRTLSIPGTNTDFTCEGLYTSSGVELYSWNPETTCKDGEPVNNFDYFQPKIMAFWLTDSNGEWRRVEVDPQNRKKVPSELMSGWKPGTSVDVIVEVSNVDAEVFDPSELSEQQITSLLAIGDEFEELTWYNPTTLQKIDRGIKITSDILTGGLSYLGRKFGETVAEGGELLIRGADFREEYFKEYKNVRTDYIDASPWLNSGKIELAFYAADSAPVAYGSNYEAFTRSGKDLSQFRIDRDTWYEVGNCQAPEDDWIQTFEVLFVPPILNTQSNEVEYWTLNMDDISRKKIRGAPVGGLNTIFVIGEIKIPSNEQTFFADGVTRNFDAEGEYYLHAAVFDRCWSPDTPVLYQDVHGLRVELGDSSPEATVCCKTPDYLGENENLIVPFYTGLFNNKYEYKLSGDCNGEIVDNSKCLDNPQRPEGRVNCYYCNDGVISTLANQVTRPECYARNANPSEPDYSPEISEIREACYTDQGEPIPPETTECISCSSLENIVPGTFCDPEEGYFPPSAINTDAFKEACGIEDDDGDSGSGGGSTPKLTLCYRCNKGVAVEITEEGSNSPQWFPVGAVGAEKTCNNLDFLSAEQAEATCGEEGEYAFINDANAQQFCWKESGVLKEDACNLASYPRKDGISYEEIDIIQDLPAFGGIQGVFTNNEEFANSMLDDRDNPICLYEYGNIMCSDDSKCVRAINSEADSRVNNKLIYDAIDDLTPADLGITAIGDFFSKQFSGKGAREDTIESLGICVIEEAPFNLRAEIAKLFGLREDDPAVIWIMIGGAAAIIFLISMLTRPRSGGL